MLNYLVFTYFSILVIFKSPVDGYTLNFDGKIAGDRTISECVNGYEPVLTDGNTKMFITTSQLARQTGYPAEEHVVKTDDGFILTLHRISGKPGAPPVFLQHGLLGSSYDWVIMGKEKALAFKLADEGYDVWMGNVRGNTYSRCHTQYKPSDSEFWNFSWHEIGVHDLPAMITHVTNTTRQEIIYIGHSMGTTSFFVMAIERPDIASKVKLMTALAPVSFLDHGTSPLRVLAPYTKQIEFIVNTFGTAEFFSQSSAVKTFLKYACTLSTIQKKICTNLLFFTTGFNSGQFNYTIASDLFYHVPAGSSLKVMTHYFQVTQSKKFRYYDYGVEKNLNLYHSSLPPSYKLSKVNVPIGLIWSDSDVFTNSEDVLRLYEQLPNVILNYRVPYPEFQHNDFLFAIDAPKYVYAKVLSFIKNHKLEDKLH